MKYIFIIFALLAIFIINGVARPAFSAEIVFFDDFKGIQRVMPDGTKKLYPDHTKWAFTFWPGIVWPDSYGDGTHWLEGNAESQTYLTPWTDQIKGKVIPVKLRYDPFTIKADGLLITADRLKPEQMGVYNLDAHRQFGSGMLLSRSSFLYGEVKMVAKVPSARGSWPAFWLLPESHEWPPEIDIFEAMAWGPHKTEIHVAAISPSHEKGCSNGWFDVGTDVSEGFHEYKMKWSKDLIEIFFDNRPVFSCPTPPSMNQPMYLLINLAVGGKWAYNELGIDPIDGIEPERLLRGSKLIADDYPASIIIQSVEVRGQRNE